MTALTFDGNDYRKRVLAAVHRRGGPEASDPFELYDIPLDTAAQWTDAAAGAQVAEVWAFWQRTRDHPKYGTLAGLLVDSHGERSAPLLYAGGRAALAAQVRAQREQHAAARYELLDQAVRRLVDRYGGIPRDKLDGLVDVGALGGLRPDEVRARLHHHRVVDVATTPAPLPVSEPESVSDHRRQQVRDLLDEFGRLQEVPPPATLLDLLGLDPNCDLAEIPPRAEAWRARCRELPPSRVRAVADELLVHVRDLLEAGPIVLDSYLDAVAHDVAAKLRPRVRAAVLVEDRLVAADHEHLLEEARALGLDPARAHRVITSVAEQLGAEVEPVGAPPSPVRRTAGRPWEQPLRAARAALRAGKLVEARRLVGEAARLDDGAGATPVRAVADEIADALRDAELRWRAVATAIGARRFAEAVEHLEQLCRTAVDVPSPAGAARADLELQRARREVATADEQVAAARSAADPVSALLDVLATWPAHSPAVAALAAMPLHPPTGVRAVTGRVGTTVAWTPSPTPGVTYRVTVRRPDGTERVVGRTQGSSIEDGGTAGPGGLGPPPVYTVVAMRAGRTSAPASSNSPVAPPAGQIEVTAERTRSGSVLVRWTGAYGPQYRVTRRGADGREQVVGHTHLCELEDGGAPAGELPTYTVD